MHSLYSKLSFLSSKFLGNVTASSIMIESRHPIISFLISSICLSQIRISELLFRLLKVSIIAIFPLFFEKVIADLHSPVDRLALTFRKPTQLEQGMANREEESKKKSEINLLRSSQFWRNAMKHCRSIFCWFLNLFKVLTL